MALLISFLLSSQTDAVVVVTVVDADAVGAVPVEVATGGTTGLGGRIPHGGLTSPPTMSVFVTMAAGSVRDDACVRDVRKSGMEGGKKKGCFCCMTVFFCSTQTHELCCLIIYEVVAVYLFVCT